jgi:hypothetical protein
VILTGLRIVFLIGLLGAVMWLGYLSWMTGADE